MRLLAILTCCASLQALPATGQVGTELRTYRYAVEHPIYGDIGTYVDTIEKTGEVTSVSSQVRIAVSIMGIVVHRERADRVVVWRLGRLVFFESVTEKNGQRITALGEERDNGFVITTALGAIIVPTGIAPSDPWFPISLGIGMVVSTESGKVDKVEVSGGEAALVSLERGSVAARHFHIGTETQDDKWEIWLDNQNVPVAFRSLESGTPITFNIVARPPERVN